MSPKLIVASVALGLCAAYAGSQILFPFAPEKQTIKEMPCPPPSEVAIKGLQKALGRDTNQLRLHYLQLPAIARLDFDERRAAADQKLRHRLAKEYGVTLVPDKAVQATVEKIGEAKSVDQIVNVINGFTQKQFDTPTNLQLPQIQYTPMSTLEMHGYTEKTNVNPAKIDFMRRNGITTVQDLARLPKELVEVAGVTGLRFSDEIYEIDANGVHGVGGLVLQAETSDLELAGGFELGGDRNSTPLHEYTHRLQYKACGLDNLSKDPAFETLNPKGFTYSSNWDDGDYSKIEQSATTSQYATSEMGEDVAESLSAGVKTNFSLAEKKPIVGQKWGVMLARLNDVSKGAPGSYFAAYSRANPIKGETTILIPPNLSVEHANANSVGTAN